MPSERASKERQVNRLPEEETLPKIRRHIEAYLGEPVMLDIQMVERFPDRNLKFRTFVLKLAKR